VRVDLPPSWKGVQADQNKWGKRNHKQLPTRHRKKSPQGRKEQKREKAVSKKKRKGGLRYTISKGPDEGLVPEKRKAPLAKKASGKGGGKTLYPGAGSSATGGVPPSQTKG